MKKPIICILTKAAAKTYLKCLTGQVKLWQNLTQVTEFIELKLYDFRHGSRCCVSSFYHTVSLLSNNISLKPDIDDQILTELLRGHFIFPLQKKL